MEKMTSDFKSHFPIFKKYPELIYLDNAATTQRPDGVIRAIHDFYTYENANIHRGVYDLSNKATSKFELIRGKVAEFLDSDNANTIAFTQGTTESMNIVARSFLPKMAKKGDNIITTLMEHHANFIPWQMYAQELGLELRVVPVDKNGDLKLDELSLLIDHKTRLLAVNHISNTLGTVNDIEKIIEIAHEKNVPVSIDAAQSASFYEISSKKLDYDFLSFSGHKLFGPFGIGILYVAPKYHEYITPYNYGGGIIKDVLVDKTTFTNYPYNLDAGTPNVEGVIGLGAALEFLGLWDKQIARNYLHNLIQYAEETLLSIPGVSVLGRPRQRSSILSFTVDQVHPHDVASFLNSDHIAVRAGMHCTQPLLDSMQTPSTVRMSATLYNTKEEIDRLREAIVELIKFWS